LKTNKKQWILGPVAHKKNETLICQSSNSYDLEEQLQHIIYKYELFKDSYLVDTMIETYKLRWYGKEEFRLILEKIGFSDIEISKANVFQKYDYGYMIRARK
jgi:hypothetical protein